jgi:Icc-related predicted phosphoesterase
VIVVGVTDIHGNVAALDKMSGAFEEADVVLLTGDLTHFGRRADAADVIGAARRHNPNVLAVAGNCDYPEVDRYLDSAGVGLGSQNRLIDGVAFIGAGGSIPCPGRTPNELSEAELGRCLEIACTDLPHGLPLVMVCHQPPLDTAVDVARRGVHVGSRAVREFVEARMPLVCFTGHIHEAAGQDSIGPTRLVNPGPARNGSYAWAQVGDGLEALEIRSV